MNASDIQRWFPLVQRVARRAYRRVHDRAIEQQDLESVGYATVPETLRIYGTDPNPAFVLRAAKNAILDSLPHRGQRLSEEYVRGKSQIRFVPLSDVTHEGAEPPASTSVSPEDICDAHRVLSRQRGRSAEIAALCAQGLSVREAAAELGVSTWPVMAWLKKERLAMTGGEAA
jgi:DNA-directed RNA polymerase specialized sigma24 family protein